MRVRAKFIVQAREECNQGPNADPTFNVFLTPVTSGDGVGEDGIEWWKYTPTGDLKLSGISHAIASHFAPGKEFYVDLTPSEG